MFANYESDKELIPQLHKEHKGFTTIQKKKKEGVEPNKRRNRNGQQTHEKRLSIATHQ